MRKIILSTLISFLLIGLSCKKPKEINERKTANTNEVINKLKVLEDSISQSWAIMSKNEDDLIFNIKRLLQEIEYIPGHNPAPLDTLKKAADSTQKVRYTQETMRESSSIDKYDEALSQLVNNTIRFTTSVKGAEKYQVVNQLQEEINQQYQKIYLNRVHYDFHVQDYNELLEKNRKKLSKINSRYGEAKSYSKFQLQQ